MSFLGVGPEVRAIFFDLGDTLGTATVGRQPHRLTRFDVFPFILSSLSDPAERGVLEPLRDRALRLGVISNTGIDRAAQINAVLKPTGLLGLLDAALLVYSGDEGVTKASREIFDRAAARAELPAASCLFVGEDAAERAVALAAGWKVCAHPLLVGEVLDGESLSFVRIIVPAARAFGSWRELLRSQPFVPQYFSGPRGTTVYGLTSGRVARALMNMRFDVDLLGEPAQAETHDLFLLRDDLAIATGFGSARGGAADAFASAQGARLVLSSTSEGVIAALPPTHGPDAFHFEQARHGHNLKLTADPLLWETVPELGPPLGLAAAREVVSPGVAEEIGRIDPDALLRTVRRYSGELALDGSEEGHRIRSRHIQNQDGDNERAVEQLAVDLEAIGGGKLAVELHRFSFLGKTLHNVEAELRGESAELVLVTAHLDATAGSDPDFRPLTSPAPGADDDASGVAAVLAIAERLVALARTSRPARTVRFVLFNAEEQGLVGSGAYARRSKARGEAIAAVWQMDMVGFNARPPQNWEVHAGFEQSPSVEARSRRLAEVLATVAAEVVPELPPPQIHHSASPGGDPAAGRSDHASFQAYGYAACAVSEDFFLDAPGAPDPDANPNYHRAGDTLIDSHYAADLARAVGAAAWASAMQSSSIPEPLPTGFSSEGPMAGSREVDSRTLLRTSTPMAAATPSVAAARTNALTASPAVLGAAGPTPGEKSFVGRALAFVQSQATAFGARSGSTAEFVPDPVVQRTSAGAAAVNLVQMYRGLSVFQMSRTVRFAPKGQVVDAAGDSAPIADDFDTEPRLSSMAAVLKAAQHLAATGSNESYQDAVKQQVPVPTIEVSGFQPEVVAGFPLPSRPTVFAKGPFENAIPAYLLIFNEPGRARLAWHMTFTFPEYVDQYVVIVAADEPDGGVLYCKSTMWHAAARGRVFEFSPGVADRRMLDFPRPLSDYPVMPTSPLTGFPADWVQLEKTVGNATRATLNFGQTTLSGVMNGQVLEFSPEHADGDDQKLLNIFYFCNYMHDFLFILGFDEVSGNFQQVNFTMTGLGGDPVRARAHSGAVNGTANMATGPDGLPPLMNMGLVVGPNRHTAFDADVVFHEYVHGLTNRLVGGGLNANALDKLQSGGMGEGWSDYFALTVQNFFSDTEKVVTGDWVTAQSGGIRRAPYSDSFPFKYGDLAQSPEVHDIGEVWCAALMMMTRRFCAALSDKQQGYRLAWQVVVDGLKLTPSNPTFLDARDAILRALDDLSGANRIPPATFKLARRKAWEAFAHFGMGANAFSGDADDLEGIVADSTIPPGV
jgi:hypothetical protein